MVAEHNPKAPSQGILHYVVGAAIICVLILINHAGMTALIDAQQRHIALSELGSRQRILFQEAGRLTHTIMSELGKDQPSTYLIEHYQRDLTEAADQLNETHNALLELARQTRLPFLPRVDVEGYYFSEPYNIDARMEDFTRRIGLFTRFPPDELKRRFMRWRSVDIAIARNGLLLRGFNELMEQLNRVSREHARVLKHTLTVLNSLIILTLIMEVLFIFRPLVQRRNRYHSELIKSQEEFKRLAHRDTLTGIANRQHLNAKLQQLIEAHSEYQSSFFLALIDLDNFKAINDQYGHNAGDQVLRVVARRLAECARANDFIARLGGDEFTMIFVNMTAKEQVMAIVERLMQSINRPIAWDDKKFFVGVSIGGAFYPDDARDADALMRYADTAMYESKHGGKNRFTIYTDRGADQSKLADEINRALRQNEFEVYYQPKVCLRTGKHAGFEALIRWYHPERGVVAPDDFIPFAEQSGHIIPITHYVLARVQKQRERWLACGRQPGRIAINMPAGLIAYDIAEDTFWRKVRGIQSVGDWLDIEITENVFLNHDPEVIRANLTRVQSLGIRTYFDDFGTGYASLTHLKDIPVNGLKIDRSFICDILVDSKAGLIVRALTELGASMGKEVIVEGVESREQLDALAGLNCDTVQGYYYSKPLEPARATAYLERLADDDAPPQAEAHANV